MKMFNLLLGALCWNAFKATPESASKRRRYRLATNFARRKKRPNKDFFLLHKKCKIVKQFAKM